MIPPFPYLGPWLDGLFSSMGDIRSQTQQALDNFNSNAPSLAASIQAAGGAFASVFDSVPVLKILIITVMAVAIVRMLVGR